MKIKHPVLKYYGSKFRLAEWIISFFPPHKHYVEPFGGAANVLLCKDPSRLETFNDLNDDIVNFFRVLRENPQDLIEQIELTPWSRTEYVRCLQKIPHGSSVELARRLFFRLAMSFSGQYNTCRGSWRRHTNNKRLFNPETRRQSLIDASQRLLTVQIENRDALKLMLELDSEETLFYLDPPYVFSTRTTSKAYSHEMRDSDHRRFAELLYGLKGYVVLSGYPSAIYEELFEQKGWLKFERAARVLGGASKIEAVWLSPRTAADLKLGSSPVF